MPITSSLLFSPAIALPLLILVVGIIMHRGYKNQRHLHQRRDLFYKKLNFQPFDIHDLGIDWHLEQSRVIRSFQMRRNTEPNKIMSSRSRAYCGTYRGCQIRQCINTNTFTIRSANRERTRRLRPEFTLTIIDSNADYPYLCVCPKTVSFVLRDAINQRGNSLFPDMPYFEKNHQIQTKDPEYARRVLNTTFIELIIQAGNMSLELCGNQIVLMRPFVWPGFETRLVEDLDIAVAIRQYLETDDSANKN